MPRSLSRPLFSIGCAVLLLLMAGLQSKAQFTPAPSQDSAFSIPQVQLIQPTELVKMLHGGGRPVIFQVGSHIMFSQAHIPGAVYAGPGSQAAGLELLGTRVAQLPKNAFIVIYCGCCPWSHCPNVGPAYQRLRALGFTNVRALYIASNFGDDWVNRGYPVEHGE